MDQRGRTWAGSGAMALTGHPGGPWLGAPGALVDALERGAAMLRERSGDRVQVDGPALLGERAAIGGLTRHGTTSCGGGTRLLPAADGWVAVALARPEDVAALPAWLEVDLPPGDPWPAVTAIVAGLPAGHLDGRAALLGLPIAALGSVEPPAVPAFGFPLAATPVTAGRTVRADLDGALVVDLSTLWAGPLCGQLLGACGATVLKVESPARPDGARRGPAAFFDLLNGTKRSVMLDLGTPAGVRDLTRLIRAADVVIESARPRGLGQLGIDALELLGADGGPAVWVSLTSHGRDGDAGGRVGFGDVAAVAGGLVAREDDQPCFLADAVMDPVAGLLAAASVTEALAAGGTWLLNCAMAPMAAGLAGPPLPVDGLEARPPRAREVCRAAPPPGSDTVAVLAGLAR